MSLLPNHIRYRVELAEILANAADLYLRIRECEADQQTHKRILATPDGLNVDHIAKQDFKDDLQSILDHIVCKYEETSLTTLAHFYFPGDAEDIINYGQALIDWISDIRKHLIQLKADTMKMLRDKEKGSELSKDSLSPDSLVSYEEQLKNVYHTIVEFEKLLKIKPVFPLSNPAPRLPSLAAEVLPNDHGVALTERLDRIRNTITTFQSSRPEFSARLSQIYQKYHSKSFQPPLLSSQIYDAVYQTVGNITSESLPHLVSTAKVGCQEALTQNEKAFDIYLGQQLHASFGLIQTVLGVANAALFCVPEEGEILQ